MEGAAGLATLFALCVIKRWEQLSICVYSYNAHSRREVWIRVRTWWGDLIAVPEPNSDMEKWWNSELTGLRKKNTRRVKAALMTYTAGNIWKERNRRIF